MRDLATLTQALVVACPISGRTLLGSSYTTAKVHRWQRDALNDCLSQLWCCMHFWVHGYAILPLRWILKRPVALKGYRSLWWCFLVVPFKAYGILP